MGEVRRLAAILAADVVGYSRLMGEDEAGTVKLVRERREAATPIVRGFGGRLVKTTGDGVLLEFPSIVAAVECAVAIQKMMAERNADLPEAKRVLYRIGVNLGDILIDGDDILGDGVNVAARLEGIAEPGGVCVSSSVLEHIQGRVAAEFLDLGEQSLKNIGKPVRAYALSADAIAAAKIDAREAASAATAAPAPPERREPPRLSLVVLPFANIGGDPEQDYFVDGVTESLTTDLSRIPGAFVIGRSTAYTYKGKAADLRQIGRELSVRYVLEGSVQRRGDRMRVNVQLIEAETGAHLWAERFDKPVADLFDIQDEIVARLANRLRVELIDVEARRAEKSPNPDSMDLVFQGNAILKPRSYTPTCWRKRAASMAARSNWIPPTSALSSEQPSLTRKLPGATRPMILAPCGPPRRRSFPKRWRRLRTMQEATITWGWCWLRPIEPSAASRNTSGRWRSIPIWRQRGVLWAWPTSLSAAQKRPRLTSSKPFASALPILIFPSASLTSGMRKPISANTRRRWAG